MTIQLDVALPGKVASSYPIRIGVGLFEDIIAWIPKKASTVVIITDSHVKKLYSPLLAGALERASYKTLVLTFPAGEKSKNNRTKAKLEAQMLAQGCGRDSVIIALGGGVVGDLAGFIAATYLRGIPYIQIPTTLLAMVDSAVGGKTGINTPQGKNLIGAFWQPIAVISDIHCLKTLSKRQIINGLIEALKIFLIADAERLYSLQEQISAILDGDEIILSNIVLGAVTIKADIVASDERENHRRAILNCGHTIGHALEQLSHYQLLHGYAVALGILVEAKIAQLMGCLGEKQYVLIHSIVNQLGIETSELDQFDVNAVIQSTQSDKKKQMGLVHYVLLKDIGCVYEINGQFVHPVPDEIIRRAFSALRGD